MNSMAEAIENHRPSSPYRRRIHLIRKEKTMKQQTLDLVTTLKQNNQDFEFYPTTKEMIKAVYDDFCLHRKYYYGNGYKDIKSFLDIGCGTCNFLTYMAELEDEAEAEFNRREKLKRLHAEANGEYYREEVWRQGWFEYFVMEKSKILIDRLPKDTVILGTDFNQNTLIDKPVDAIFCNPPYSEFEEWTRRIIREGSCEYIYLVIPERWKEKAEIVQTITEIVASYKVLGSFDFLNAERAARAKVDVVLIDKTQCKKNQAFNDWFDATFQMRDKAEKQDYELEQEKKAEVKNQLVAGKNKVEILVNSYNNELRTMYNHFKAISGLDVDILESIGVSKKAVIEALQNKIAGLKNIYWHLVFEELDEITSRLTAATKEKLLKRFSGLLTVDFTGNNIYSLLVWVCKNATAYYDEQLIELYKDFTSPDNIIKYKSNQKVFKADKWYNDRPRFNEPDKVTHYCLSYRIICDRLHFNDYSSWSGSSINNYRAQTIVKDLCAIAHNLGFKAKRWDIPECFGAKYYVWLDEGKPLLEFKVYQNGNTHIKLDKEFAKAMNVEVSRLLGWIRDRSDIAEEFPDDMAKGAEKYFKANFSIDLINQSVKLLGAA